MNRDLKMSLSSFMFLRSIAPTTVPARSHGLAPSPAVPHTLMLGTYPHTQVLRSYDTVDHQRNSCCCASTAGGCRCRGAPCIRLGAESHRSPRPVHSPIHPLTRTICTTIFGHHWYKFDVGNFVCHLGDVVPFPAHFFQRARKKIGKNKKLCAGQCRRSEPRRGPCFRVQHSERACEH